jgi:hypothetical protein
VAAGERRDVSFAILPRQLEVIEDAGRSSIEPGVFRASVGGKQPDQRGLADGSTTGVVTATFAVVGR